MQGILSTSELSAYNAAYMDGGSFADELAASGYGADTDDSVLIFEAMASFRTENPDSDVPEPAFAHTGFLDGLRDGITAFRNIA